MTEDFMIDEHDSALTDELATSLHATAALTPRTADPYGPLGTAIARDRRRRTTIGASLAVVAVVGAAVGISGEVNHRGPASDPTPGAAAAVVAGTTNSPVAPPTSPVTHGAAPKTQLPPPILSMSTSQAMMLGWPTDYSLFPGYATSKSEAVPTVDAVIHAYGKQVDEGTRNVLVNLVGSFKLCGFQLNSYDFTLRWAGGLAHSGGQGAVVVDVSHGGATYRMVGFDSYKGVWLQLPGTVDASEAAHVEAAPLPELDQPAQTIYEPVVAAPGSKVTISGTETNGPGTGSTPFHTDTVTVGSSGVVEVKLTGHDGEGLVPFPTVTAVTIVRPDGTTASAPLLGATTAAHEQTARELLPANTTCPGLTPETPSKS
jgi:hypothetical protein